MEHLPELFAELELEVVSSLPYYQEYFTDKQRGRGVFDKSIEALERLNGLGYGVEGSGLELSLVYHPVFTRLYAIANMPVNRFREDLERRDQLEPYLEKLLGAFNPQAVEGLMCRDMVSIDHDGRIFDCDFNQQLGMDCAGPARSIFDLDPATFLDRDIRFGDHCFGCTAGAGSSCGGATA